MILVSLTLPKLPITKTVSWPTSRKNTYEPGPDGVTRSRNCVYQVYFDNKADCRWIRVLGDQLTGNYKQFAHVFKEATKRPYDCITL